MDGRPMNRAINHSPANQAPSPGTTPPTSSRPHPISQIARIVLDFTAHPGALVDTDAQANNKIRVPPQPAEPG